MFHVFLLLLPPPKKITTNQPSNQRPPSSMGSVTTAQKLPSWSPQKSHVVTLRHGTSRLLKKGVTCFNRVFECHLGCGLFDKLQRKRERIQIFQLQYQVGGFNPIEKYMLVKLDHFPTKIGKNKKCLSCHHTVLLYIYGIIMVYVVTLQRTITYPPF